MGRLLVAGSFDPRYGLARGLRSGPDADIYKLEMLLGAALSLAQKRIRIVTPYFLPDARLQFAIQQGVLCSGRGGGNPAPGQKRSKGDGVGDAGELAFFRAISASISSSSAAAFRPHQALHGGWGMVADRQLKLGRAAASG